MKNRFENQTIRRANDSALGYDAGLRAYMLKVYNYMALGLGLTGGVAFVSATTSAILAVVMPLMWVFMLAPLALVFFLSFRIDKISFSTAQTVFWLYATLNGVAFSILFLAYTGDSIARVFFITAGTFGAMSLYGYTTQKDLTGWGSFLFMGLIGIILASVVNIFVGSSPLQFLISIGGVVIFTGLTAYDTQVIKEGYVQGFDDEVSGKQAIFGALRLYLDFINLFISLLRLLGDRR
ncbi:Bax inhibitor-1/YccA family protein [Candidatus Bealeia paramacronuclearis]|uniref:Bax inhibitor-1/YccA family protein n=1 Tax=Candidatus Bealeia paramacronuclearis TaxID=1921001 RepID=A0ABZ2C2H1_9PROT|nr:Bax inhibitor-1/YccA family protein [Candidatus Bealeia paramacronuclearis]